MWASLAVVQIRIILSGWVLPREWVAVVLSPWVIPSIVNELRQALKIGLFLGYVGWEHIGRACVSCEQDRWL